MYHQVQRSKLLRSLYFLQLKLILIQSNAVPNFIRCLCETYINILQLARFKIPLLKNLPPKNLYGFFIFLMHDIHSTVFSITYLLLLTKRELLKCNALCSSSRGNFSCPLYQYSAYVKISTSVFYSQILFHTFSFVGVIKLELSDVQLMKIGTHTVGFIKATCMFTVQRTKMCLVCHLGLKRDGEEARMNKLRRVTDD
jgi:hypothetical protein